MPSRINTYAALLQQALDQGYQTHSIASFWKQITKGFSPGNVRYLVLRHDVDTDPHTARLMWDCERLHSVVSSFYFRLSTVDPGLMKEIHAYGSEASYHYEELATVAKSRGLSTATEVMHSLPEIRGVFKQNVRRLREMLGLPLSTVASHGDFVNRKLRIPNTVLLSDESLRKELSIEVEAYDHDLTRHFTARHSDQAYPTFWNGTNPVESFANAAPIVHILTHPRHWRSAPWINTIDNFNRFREGFLYYSATFKPERSLK